MTTIKQVKIGFGGGCHWCTEGIFTSLVGILSVHQGWIASRGNDSAYSEAIEVIYEPETISLSSLIEIHLHTHASTSNHSMRGKYRSAIYAYDNAQYDQALSILNAARDDFDQPLVTNVYMFEGFKLNKPEFSDYFYTDPNRPFCQTYIHPKLKILLARFSRYVDQSKLTGAGVSFPTT